MVMVVVGVLLKNLLQEGFPGGRTSSLGALAALSFLIRMTPFMPDTYVSHFSMPTISPLTAGLPSHEKY